MLVALLLALLLAAPPDIGCNLVVDGNLHEGGPQITAGDFVAKAGSRQDYSLQYKGQKVRARILQAVRMASVSWRPTEATTAMFTCTVHPATQRPDKRKERILLACLTDDGVLELGENRIHIQRGKSTWTAMAAGYELRLQVTSPNGGYVGVWADHDGTRGNAAVLKVGAHSLTCWRP